MFDPNPGGSVAVDQPPGDRRPRRTRSPSGGRSSTSRRLAPVAGGRRASRTPARCDTPKSGTMTIHPNVLRIARSMLWSVKTNLKLSRPTNASPASVLEADEDRVDDRVDQEDGQDHERRTDEDVGPHAFAIALGQEVDDPVHPPVEEEDASDADDDRDADDEEPVRVRVAQEVERRPQDEERRRRDRDRRDEPARMRGRAPDGGVLGRDGSSAPPRLGGSMSSSPRALRAGRVRERPLSGRSRPPPWLRLLGRPCYAPASSPRCSSRMRLERVRAVLHVAHHPGPEAPGSDLRRHLVGGVEPGGPARRERLGQDLRGVGEDRVRVAVRPDVHVRRDPRAPRLRPHRALDVLGHEPLEEVRRPRAGWRTTTASSPANRVALLVDRRGTGTSRSRRRPPCPPGRTALMKLACRCSQQLGGSSNIGAGASPNAMRRRVRRRRRGRSRPRT